MGARDRAAGGGLDERDAIEPMLEDGVDVAVGTGADGEGPRTGRFQPRVAVALTEPQEPQAGAVALLGMRAVCQRSPKQSHPGSPIVSQCGEVTGLLLGVG